MPAQSGRELVFIKKNETSAKIQLAEFPGQAVQEKPAVLTNRKAMTQPEDLARETDRAGPSKRSGLWHVVMTSTEETKTRPQRMGRKGCQYCLPSAVTQGTSRQSQVNQTFLRMGSVSGVSWNQGENSWEKGKAVFGGDWREDM